MSNTYIAQCPKGNYSAVFILGHLTVISFCFVLVPLFNMKINYII